MRPILGFEPMTTQPLINFLMKLALYIKASYLKQPGLEVGVDEDVVSVELEAVSLVRHEHLAGGVDGEFDGHDGLDDDVLDGLHQLVRVDAVRLEVTQQRAQRPLVALVLRVRVVRLHVVGVVLVDAVEKKGKS